MLKSRWSFSLGISFSRSSCLNEYYLLLWAFFVERLFLICAFVQMRAFLGGLYLEFCLCRIP